MVEVAIESESWKDDKDSCTFYTLSTSDKSLIVKILSYGATIVSILTPDNTGKLGDLVLGFDSLSDYKLKNSKENFQTRLIELIK